jgi:hypothetical protein
MDDSQVKNFNRDGFVIGLDVLTADEVAFYLESFLAYEDRLGGKVTGAYRYESSIFH